MLSEMITGTISETDRNISFSEELQFPGSFQNFEKTLVSIQFQSKPILKKQKVCACERDIELETGIQVVLFRTEEMRVYFSRQSVLP